VSVVSLNHFSYYQCIRLRPFSCCALWRGTSLVHSSNCSKMTFLTPLIWCQLESKPGYWVVLTTELWIFLYCRCITENIFLFSALWSYYVKFNSHYICVHEIPFQCSDIVGQEWHPACKKLGVGLLMVMIWLEFTCCLAPVVSTNTIFLSSNKIQHGDILALAYPGCPGKLPLNDCCCYMSMYMKVFKTPVITSGCWAFLALVPYTDVDLLAFWNFAVSAFV